MDSFGNSSQGSVPINPMMAMIQRQQQEQQQYEALSAGTTMGINSGISSSTTTSITQNTAMMTSQQSIPSSGNNNNSVPYSPQTIAYSQEQRQQETPVMTQQRPLHQSNEMFNTNRQNRPPYYDTQNAPYYPTFIPQQQLFNMGHSSPSRSPAPNHTQFYSNVDFQSPYYSDPSILNQQAFYMNTISSSNIPLSDNNTSSYLGLQQQMPVPFMNNPYLPLSYSPVPQIFMASTPVESLSNGDHIPGNMSMTKMGYPDPAMTSNLTSMPVQATVMATNNLTDNPPTSIQQETGSISSPSTPMHQPITDSKSTKESSSMSNSTNQSPVQSAIPTKVIYHPKTRQVETHGGVDLKYFDKFEIRPAIPYIEELGTVDITALTMSLKSGMKMEVTTALNTITTLSLLPRVLLLVHCEDLLDCLLDHLETCLFESNLRDYLKENENDSPDVTIKSSMYTYADLFEAALLEMKSLIPALEPTCSDEWIPLRDRCLCIFNLLRNLSFMEENAEYLATHPRLTHLLMRIILSSENHHTLTTTGNSTNNDTVSSPSSPSVAVENISKIRSMDLLDFRKSILVIYSNIALAMKKLTIHPEATVSVVHLIYEFLVNDSETYYSLLAMETWNKFAVHEEHRQLLGSLLQTESDNGICSDHDNKDDDENNKEHEANKSDGCDNDNMFNDDNKNYSKGNRNNKSSDDKDIVHIPMSQYIQGIWISLIGMLRRHFYLIEMGMTVTSNNTQLAILEMIVMGLYHVVAIADTNFCDKLIQADRGIAMTILRICMTLAEADNVHYRVVAQRGMEMVYVLILGGGCKVTELVRQKRQYGRFQQQQQQQQQQKHHNHYQQQQQQQYQKQHSMFPITNDDLGDEESSYKIGVTLRARILLNHNVLQEKLMMAMLKPISDNFILTGLDDLLNLMDEMTLYD